MGVVVVYVLLFDFEVYVVGLLWCDLCWCVEFNGLGELDFCFVVCKMLVLIDWLVKDVLGQVQVFVDFVGVVLFEWVLVWVYLSEIEGLFVIEGEVFSYDKVSWFVVLLKQVYQQQLLMEELLVVWQNVIVFNLFDFVGQFCIEQNWL